MKNFLKKALLCLGLTTMTSQAQEADKTNDLDCSPIVNTDASLLVYNSTNTENKTESKDITLRPDHVNNAETKYFPPVFNQAGGSCGSASRICYMFTHELNTFRGTDGSFMANRYPSHFVWLLTNGNSGKGEFMKKIGVPSAEVYGGYTYSELFGNQAESNNDFGWMNGYDKWYSAMFNRMSQIVRLPQTVATEAGREALKNWLWNHNGDTDFHAGGLGGIGVASAGSWQPIPKTPANDKAGVSGLKYVARWGDKFNHALTIVGYDDRIEFDLNKNGIYGEESADEKGAWIIVNSWGNKWCNQGFVYCPYAYGGKRFNKHANGSYTFDSRNWWDIEILKVRKNYRPFRTIKLKMDYSHRSEIRLSAGISTNLNAENPEHTEIFHHFNFAGDGNRGNTNPAPAIPMLGKWADGKLHYEPMEFGYDLTDLTKSFDRNTPLKYFFIIETKEWAQGKGHIYKASIIDYEHDLKGIEFPFDIHSEGVEIKNQGNKTIISTIVFGEGFTPPNNLSIHANTLKWSAPMSSSHPVLGYKIYADGELLAQTESNVLSYSFNKLCTPYNFSVSAIYGKDIESEKININTPVLSSSKNTIIDFSKSGFVIPEVFNKKYNESTIEFWIAPNSLANCNQTMGPGWGKFLFHSSANGKIIVGWDEYNQIATPPETLQVGIWKHIAIVVNHNIMKLFVDGVLTDSITSITHSGLGGFGELIFKYGRKKEYVDAKLDELRIWNYAKSNEEILTNKDIEYTGQLLPSGLIAYYKGDIITTRSENFLVDCIGGHHARILNKKYLNRNSIKPSLKGSDEVASVKIIPVANTVRANVPVILKAKYSATVNTLKWNIPTLRIRDLYVTQPTLTFPHAGVYMIKVEASTIDGKIKTDTYSLIVGSAPTYDAAFSITPKPVVAGERVSFLVKRPMIGCSYEWAIPGSDKEKIHAMNTAATYDGLGHHRVTLTVTTPNGKKISSNQEIEVIEITPVADFEIMPSIIIKEGTTFLKDKSKFSPTTWRWLITNDKNTYFINGQNTSLTIDKPGVYDIQLIAGNSKGSSNKTKKRALTVCNADSKNGLNFNNRGAHIQTTHIPLAKGQRKFTIEWWMNPNKLTNYCCGIGDSQETLLIQTDSKGKMTLHIGKDTNNSNDYFVIPHQWHHYAITFEDGLTHFYRDGIQFSTKMHPHKSLPNLKKFNIGTKQQAFKGQIDEFRIWHQCLSEKALHQYNNAPISDIKSAEKENQLVLYYDFNQGGGNATDLTSNNNDGIRYNFGPDGDAWGLSSGVFCLNLNTENEGSDVTAKYLRNFKRPFNYDKKTPTNITQPNRFFAITDWSLENTTHVGPTTTGIHVDKENYSLFTCTTSKDDFSNKLKNHKIYQTITLPAGMYEFIANCAHKEKYPKECKLVAAIGKGLPNEIDLKKEALAYTSFHTQKVNSIRFTLTEKKQISLGLVLNMSGEQSISIANFQLIRYDYNEIKADDADGYNLNVDASGYRSLFLPYATLIPKGVTVYVAKEIKKNNIILEPYNDSVLPAKTGAIVKAKPGNYQFLPSSVAGSLKSAFKGVTRDTKIGDSLRYYTFRAKPVPSLHLTNDKVLPANSIYIPQDANVTVEKYAIEILHTDINKLFKDEDKKQLYDISGRRIHLLTKGVYMTKDGKITLR